LVVLENRKMPIVRYVVNDDGAYFCDGGFANKDDENSALDTYHFIPASKLLKWGERNLAQRVKYMANIKANKRSNKWDTLLQSATIRHPISTPRENQPEDNSQKKDFGTFINNIKRSCERNRPNLLAVLGFLSTNNVSLSNGRKRMICAVLPDVKMY